MMVCKTCNKKTTSVNTCEHCGSRAITKAGLGYFSPRYRSRLSFIFYYGIGILVLICGTAIILTAYNNLNSGIQLEQVFSNFNVEKKADITLPNRELLENHLFSDEKPLLQEKPQDSTTDVEKSDNKIVAPEVIQDALLEPTLPKALSDTARKPTAQEPVQEHQQLPAPSAVSINSKLLSELPELSELPAGFDIRYIESGGPEASLFEPPKHIMPQNVTADAMRFSTKAEYQKSKTTWGSVLNPTGKIPTSGFSAFYINTKQTNTTIFSETVEDISINYSHNEFHGIDSPSFGGYWVGEIHNSKNELNRISISQGNSKTRLIIDGIIIYEGDGNKDLLYNFKPGTHRIEVEHVNNWHTTEFSLRIIKNKTKYFSLTEAHHQIQKRENDEYDINLVSIYNTLNKDMSVILHIIESESPQVLLLNTYSSIKWIISNPDNTAIVAIVYKSYHPGSIVVGDINETTLLLPTQDQFSKKLKYSKPNCINMDDRLHCSGSGFLSAKIKIENVFQSKLTGFTMTHSADSVIVPEVRVTE